MHSQKRDQLLCYKAALKAEKEINSCFVILQNLFLRFSEAWRERFNPHKPALT